MHSTWGEKIRISIFGESHGKAIGIVVDGLPAGEVISYSKMLDFLARRKPGLNVWSTPRKETDKPEILSGMLEGKTTGAPLALIIHNQDTKSQDYENLKTIPRPGHADLTALFRYHGAADMRGSGHFSGRITAPVCAAGSIALQLLEKKGIRLAARIIQIADIEDPRKIETEADFAEILTVAKKDFPVISDAIGQKMKARILEAKDQCDSVGGIIQVLCWNYPQGIGSPFFGGIEPMLAPWFYAIPAVKGLSFGDGFRLAKMQGSSANDAPEFIQQGENKHLHFKSNHAGGIMGGISNGMPIIAEVAFKPTASIGLEQDSVNLIDECNTKLKVEGRHDPCIVPRAVPVVESMMALGLLDLLAAAGQL